MAWLIVVGKALVGGLVGALVALGLLPIGVLCGVVGAPEIALTVAPVVGAAVGAAIP